MLIGRAMSIFTILLGGDLIVTPRLRAQIASSRVIAADSGIRHADGLGLEPELWVGDFDSSDAALQTLMARIPRQSFPPEKDRTDGEIAVDVARALGATDLILAGAFGGPRADHAFLHMTLATQLSGQGLPVLLSSGDQEGIPLRIGENHLNLPDGTLFSILGFEDLVVSIGGAKWPLTKRHVPFGSSLTLSNYVASPDGSLTVTLDQGRAILAATLA